MRRGLSALSLIILVSILIFSGSMPSQAQGATNTYTPSLTANFVLPLINVPILLPTAFMPPLPTTIPVNVTAAVNMNPYGLIIPGNPIWAWNEGLNWMQGIFSAMGWLGNLLYFVFVLLMAWSIMQKLRRGMMGEAPVKPSESAESLGRRGKRK